MQNDVLRARTWDEYIGQGPLKARLDVHMRAAVLDGRPLDHVLLAAPPGFGKTTLASIVAAQLGDPFHSITCPIKPAAFVTFFRRFQGGVVLLDEIHRLPKSQQEDLLTVLEDGYLQVPNGQRVEIRWLTVIAATTEPEKVTSALYDRFRLKPSYEAYEPLELAEIVAQMALRIGLDCGIEILAGIAQAASGVPRLARNLVLGARDLQSIDEEVTMEAILKLCETDAGGLAQTHLDYLGLLRHVGGQAGLELLATMLRLHPSIVRESERLLVEKGLVGFTAKGRELTSAGWAYGQPVAASPRRINH